jgi:hypothetical protein
MPEVHLSGSTASGFPDSSKTGPMLNAHNSRVIPIQTEREPRYRPGQILREATTETVSGSQVKRTYVLTVYQIQTHNDPR